MEPTDIETHVCAACDLLVDDNHPDESMCSDIDCGIWFHTVENHNTCPECESEGL